MALIPGTHLGVCEITDHIGASRESALVYVTDRNAPAPQARPAGPPARDATRFPTKAGVPRLLFEGPYARTSPGRSYDVTADGQFIMSRNQNPPPTGAHLWAETYDRPFRAEDIFALQDDLVPRIVSTVADMNGVLRRSMSDAVRGRRPDQLTSYEAALRGFGHFDRVTPEDHADVRDILERAVRVAPGASDCWAMLSGIDTSEFSNDFNPRPDPLERALDAAHRAVDATPTNPIAHYALALALFFRRDIAAFRHATERAIALNPMDSATTAHMGFLLAYAGDWPRGCALVERAAQLNQHHPGWYWFPSFYNAYRQGAYQAALDAAVKINMPHYFFTHVILAMAHGQLGEREAAQKALRDLLALKPDFGPTARQELGKWFQPELIEHLIDGLRKAGLEVAPDV